MSKRSLMISLQQVNEDIVKIVLDDLIRLDETKILKDVLYTCKEYDLNDFQNLNFDEKELADFGYSIIARLAAFYERREI